MLATASYQDVHTDLAQALQQFWDEYAAIRPARVRVVSGEGAIVVWLEEVLSPAERQMAGAQEGHKMLQELGERILEQARPHLRQLVADTVGHEDIEVEVHLDAAGGNLVGFFRLGWPVLLSAASRQWVLPESSRMNSPIRGGSASPSAAASVPARL